jgi:hypothetical protein
MDVQSVFCTGLESLHVDDDVDLAADLLERGLANRLVPLVGWSCALARSPSAGVPAGMLWQAASDIRTAVTKTVFIF